MTVYDITSKIVWMVQFQENFKYFVIIQIRIPPDTEDEADWVVRLDGL